MKHPILTSLLTGAFVVCLGVPFASSEGGHGYSKGHGTTGKGHGGSYSRGYGNKGHGHGRMSGMGHHATTGHLIRGLLGGAKEMGLSDDQVKQLKGIQLDLDRTRIKTEADIKVAEREARALMDDDSSDISSIEAKLKESASQQVSLRVAAVKAKRKAMAVLTPEQAVRVKKFHDMMKQKGKGAGHKTNPHGKDVRPSFLIPKEEGEQILRPPLESLVVTTPRFTLLLLVMGLSLLVSSAVFSQPLRSEEETFPDPTEYLGSVKIHIQEAIALATKRIPGVVILAELEPSPEDTMWEIEIVTQSGEVQEVFVHAVTGALSFPKDVEEE